MHYPLKLARRPLLTIEASPSGGVIVTDGVGDDVAESVVEPHKADAITNRLRKIVDRFSGRRFERAKYNRRQRHLYHGRVAQSLKDHRPQTGPRPVHRTAPEKRFGVGRLRSR